jgi:hypothetical protein
MVYGLGLGSIATVFGKPFNEQHYKNFNKLTRRLKVMPWKVDRQTLLNSTSDPDEREAIEYYFSEECKEGLAFAKSMKKQYFTHMPMIENFLMQAQDACKRRGWVKTWKGRRRHFLKPKEEAYKAPNSIIQGGCGDILKEKLPLIQQYIDNTNAPVRLVNLVHDEVVLEAPPTALKHIQEIRKIMEDLPFSVPMGVDLSYSDTNWAEKIEVSTDEDISCM